MGDPPGDDDLTIGDLYNGDWIDGEAYHDNLDEDATHDTAFDALQNGGEFSLEQDDGSWVDFVLAKPQDEDIVFIEFRDHGSSTSPRSFKTYDNNYDSERWYADDINTVLNAIDCKYMILELDFCYSGYSNPATESGGFICEVDNVDNRIVVTSEKDEVSDRYAYLFYGRIRGDVDVEFSIEGTIHDESEVAYDHDEDDNADGIESVTNRERNHLDAYVDKFISITEAHYMGDIVCNDRYGNIQQPQMDIGTDIPDQIFL